MKLVLSPDTPGHRIAPEVQSSFAEHLGRCVYGGIWVGEDARIENVEGYRAGVLEALRKLQLPALRWPGGCFADLYHWRDGIGPRDQRPVRHNHWWPMPEDNAFGTHEFLRFCELAEAEPYIALNVGTGSAQESHEWVEYVNSSQDTTLTRLRKANGREEPWGVKLWGIGNESWGCGGLLDPSTYADEVRRHINFLHGSAAAGSRFIIAGGHHGIPEWEDQLLARLGAARNLVHGFSPHFYAGIHPPLAVDECRDCTRLPDWGHEHYIGQLNLLQELLGRACGLAESFSARGNRLGVYLDEWSIWHPEATSQNGLWQQVTLGDTLWAAEAFHVMHEHAKWLDMAAIAQTANVLQAKVITRGPETVLTPTYHLFEMFMPHRGGRVVPSAVEGVPHFETERSQRRRRVSASASVNAAGTELFLSVVNLDDKAAESVTVELASRGAWTPVQARRMTGTSRGDHNDFGGAGSRVAPHEMALWPAAGSFVVEAPPLSLTTVKLRRE